jgi:hypothetical protein
MAAMICTSFYKNYHCATWFFGSKSGKMKKKNRRKLEKHPSSMLLAAKVVLFFQIAFLECRLKCYNMLLIKSFFRGSFWAKPLNCGKMKTQYLKK